MTYTQRDHAEATLDRAVAAGDITSRQRRDVKRFWAWSDMVSRSASAAPDWDRYTREERQTQATMDSIPAERWQEAEAFLKISSRR